MKTTFGWSLLLVVVLCVLVGRYLAAKRENRLDGGIDPVFVNRDETPSPAVSTKVG